MRREGMLPFEYYTREELSRAMNNNEHLAQFVANAQMAEIVLGVPTGHAAAAQRLLDAHALTTSARDSSKRQANSRRGSWRCRSAMPAFSRVVPHTVFTEQCASMS